MRRRVVLVAALAVTITRGSAGAAAAGENASGFRTAQPSMLTPVMPGVEVR